MTTLYLRAGSAVLGLALFAGCTTIDRQPASAATATSAASATSAPVKRIPDTAGWRRIHAGAGRT